MHSDINGGNKQSVAFRKPQRITITVPKSVYEYLVETSAYEGRSLSNYASYLLERSAEGR
ncbi:hypothetical protein H8F27_09975 [Synechococcus sp. CBW1108]|nr:hypothetical protein H8F27_09975 [Synechococcus sp. CBW1108]